MPTEAKPLFRGDALRPKLAGFATERSVNPLELKLGNSIAVSCWFGGLLRNPLFATGDWTTAMSLPEVVLVVFAAFAVIGAACLILLFAFWRSVGSVLNDLWPKVVTEIIQVLSGLASVGGAFAVASQKPDWLRPAIAGAICLGLWKVVQLVVDNRTKASDKLGKSELERSISAGAFRSLILEALRKAVDRKVKRLRKEVARKGEKPSIGQVRNALTPKPHLDDLLESLGVFFQAQLTVADAEKVNFRIGVYIERSGALTPLHAISLADPGYNPFTSYERHRDRFQLGPENTRPAHAVLCVRQKGIVVVEDCGEATKGGGFSFFDGSQASYLRSMVAYYLGKVSDERGTMIEAAVVADTNRPGFFAEAERASLEFCLREFGSRLRLELLLAALIAKRGVNE